MICSPLPRSMVPRQSWPSAHSRKATTPAGTGRDGVFRYQVRAEDPDGSRDLRYSLIQAPEGMSVSPLGGLVQWHPRPDQVGVHPVEIVVEDDAGGRVSQRFDLTLTPPPDPQAPAAPAP